VDRPTRFFQGSEFPRLLVLAVFMVVGWALIWQFSQNMPEGAEREVTATGQPEPVVPDRSVEFETVTDRSPMEFRDNAAYGMLLERARGRSPDELAAIARRDLVLAHLWQNPQQYRGIPVHLLGTAHRVLRYPSKLSPSGWLYEAWIITPETTRLPYVCIFEDIPEGFPIGSNVSERVVFNGYFLKIMKYQAADVTRGAPVLIGRIGWNAHQPVPTDQGNSFLHWSLVIIAAFFFISLARWVIQLGILFRKPRRANVPSSSSPSDEIEPAALDAWARSMGGAEPWEADQDDAVEN
jgi:hypothetical protein